MSEPRIQPGEALEAASTLARAELDGDRVGLDASLAAQFCAVRSDGGVVERAAFLERARGKRRLGALERTALQVEVAGDVAMVTCVDEARTPVGGAGDAGRFRTRLVFERAEEGGQVRLIALDRTALRAGADPVRRRLHLRVLSWLSVAATLVAFFEAALHFGARIPLGPVMLREPPSTWTGVAQTLIGTVLALATYGLFGHGHCGHAVAARRWASRAFILALFEVLVGIAVVSGGSGPAVHTNVLEYLLMLTLVVPGLVGLESPAGRAAVYPDALSEM